MEIWSVTQMAGLDDSEILLLSKAAEFVKKEMAAPLRRPGCS